MCRRAVKFIVYTSGTVRDELHHAADYLRKENLDYRLSNAARKTIIDNLVIS